MEKIKIGASKSNKKMIKISLMLAKMFILIN